MRKKLIYMMSIALAFIALDISLRHSPVRAVPPQYLETCTYDINGLYLWHKCGYAVTEDCDKSNC